MNRQFLFVVAMSCMAIAVFGVDHSMVAGDAGGTSSYNSGINWDDGQAPVAGNDYFMAGNNMRTPDGDSSSDNHVFAGDSLTVNSGNLAWKSAGACTITNFIIDGGSLGHWRDWATGRLYGNLLINSGKTWVIDSSGNNPRRFDIYSQISGSGSITMRLGSTDGTDKRVNFHGMNTNFTGKIRFERYGPFGFADERALGPNPASYVSDQLSMYGGYLRLTNNITIDDSNRGINLRTGSGYEIDGGGFDVADGITATVACLINGAGDLGKDGDGKLVLATNETYTGDTYVYGGELNIASGASILSTGIVVSGSSSIFSGTGVYESVTLMEEGSIRGLGAAGFTVSNLRFAGGGIGIDPTADDPSTPRVTVTGSMVKDPFFPVTVNVLALDTVQQSYKVLDADDLDGVAAHDLCVNPPWAGALEIQDNGSGGQVLVLTTMPATNIQYQIKSDDYGHSAMLETNWTDHLAPSAGKYYVDKSYSMRTPQSGSHTFAGDRLIFDGQGLAMKGPGLPTVNDCVVMNNSTMSLAEPPIGRIDGNITLHPILDSGRTHALSIYGWTPLRSFHMYADLFGYGELRLASYGDPSYGDCVYTMRAMNSNFYGRIRFDGNTNFTLRVTYEENIGGQPPAFRADHLTFNGGGLSVTNDVIIDDSNRGITLLADGGVSGTSSDSGGFPSGTPVEDRVFGGGAVFIADAGHALTISCPITGPGGILKNGEGKVILAGSNSYTGLTQIVNGGLAGVNADAFGAGPVMVEGAGRLLALYSESMPANGVELGGMIEFVNGGGVRVELADGVTQPSGNFSMPLFLLPEGESIDTGVIPVEHSLQNGTVELTTSTVGSQTLVSASFTSYAGTLITVR